MTDVAKQMVHINYQLREYLRKFNLHNTRLGGTASGYIVRQGLPTVQMEKFWLAVDKMAIWSNPKAIQELWKEMNPGWTSEPPVGRPTDKYFPDDVLPLRHPHAEEAIRKAKNTYEDYKKRLWKKAREELLQTGKLRDSTCEQIGKVAYDKGSELSSVILYGEDRQVYPDPSTIDHYYVASMEVNI